ncbi:hypothetical protein Acsp03_57320 [Actinomadura sp. NBRC 104412]|uniref:peptidoglycan-binding domain-containing protein n=1 Tax=Actinomadura sp. NBRC 104412 TaxID=3032203 RepID=UPI0024A33AB6|nr:peptidoglycan-binding protein [Actinomadura sp. NBRC 104412]GLZ08266.1 hypothetical protein Acsp03_57320 [Actinomadura sp. NBRC 104412]
MKIALRLAAILVAVALGAGTMGAAHADGPKTDRRVVAAIEAQPWVVLQQGDTGYRVTSARCFLTQFGFFDDCRTDADTFDAELAAAVGRYQDARDLPRTGRIDAETWLAMRYDHGVAGPGDRRSHLVRGLQHALNMLGDAIPVDGIYGSRTTTAVRNFQTRKSIDSDGLVGPITFRAMFAEGAEAARTPGL